MPSRSQSLLAALAALMILTSIPPASAEGPGSFVDDDQSRFQPYIEKARSIGMIQGCNPPANDRFCPHRTVTRGEMAVMLARVIELPAPQVKHFTDNDGHPAERAIESLAEAGLTNGCGEQRFCPDRPLTRGEMAALIVRAMGWQSPETPFPYRDLEVSPYGGAVAALARHGGIEPCDPPVGRRMCPEGLVSRDEATFSLTSALELRLPFSSTAIQDHPSLGLGDGFETLDLWDGRLPSARNRVGLTEGGYRGHGLRVRIPQGSHFGADFKLNLKKYVGEDPELLYFRYFLRLDPDWAPPYNGKLPGFSGVYGNTGKGGYPSSATSPGWSARMTFFRATEKESRARLGYYVYHLGQEGRYGDGMMWNEAGKLRPGDWYCIEGQVALNTLGLADGALRAWVDGTPAFDVAGIQFRRPGEPNIRIESFWFNVYYGGKPVADRNLGMTIDEVAVDNKRIGCGEGAATSKPVRGDFTGDGFDDLMWWGVCPGSTCFQQRSTDVVGPLPALRLGDGAWFSLETHQTGLAAGDLDGDGREDLIYRGRCDTSVRCWRVHRSAGDALGTGENWGDGARLAPAADRLLTGDWNGDGRDDVAYRGICGSDAVECWRVHLSNGELLGDPENWGPPTLGDSSTLTATDITGDGRDDLVYVGPCGEKACWFVQASTGSSFDEPRSMGTVRSSELKGFRFFDFDGDGDSDLVAARDSEGSGLLEVRSMQDDGLGDPVLIAEFDDEVQRILLRRRAEGQPVEALVTVRCDVSTCVQPRTLRVFQTPTPEGNGDRHEVRHAVRQGRSAHGVARAGTRRRGASLTLVVVQAISLVALLLLAASGVAKAVDPEPTTRALRAARLPARHTLTRLLGLIEIAAGAAAVADARGPLLGGILYLGFGLFTLLALRGGFAVESCGCFGREDTPPSVIHVAYNFAAAGSLLVLFVSNTPLLPALGSSEAVSYLGFGLLGAYLSYLLLTRLPQTLALARDGS